MTNPRDRERFDVFDLIISAKPMKSGVQPTVLRALAMGGGLISGFWPSLMNQFPFRDLV